MNSMDRRSILSSDPDQQGTRSTVLTAVTAFVIIGLIGLVLYFCVLALQAAKQQQLMESAALSVLRGESVAGINDKWGTPLHGVLEKSSTMNVATVVSAGPDKKLGSTDDILCERIDYNKTRVVGEWVGSHMKEAAGGFIAGLKEKSKHE